MSISRILSLSSHPSERPTWTSAGHLQAVLFGLASGGVCPAAASPRRWCALTAPFHPCLSAVHVGRRTSAVCFCGTFPRVSPGRSLDCLTCAVQVSARDVFCEGPGPETHRALSGDDARSTMPSDGPEQTHDPPKHL